MKRVITVTTIVATLFIVSCISRKGADDIVYSGNPVIPGWYADPEGIIIDNEYWIFPAWSDHYGDSVKEVIFSEHQLKVRGNVINKQYLNQTFLDAFSSPDLEHWQKHPAVLSVEDVQWAAYSLWATSVVEAKGKC